jgi:anti-anti-sigma regulatory factor
MIRFYQANSTLLVTFDNSDNLSLVNLKHLMKQMVLKLKAPFGNVIVDMKGISSIDRQGVSVMLLGQRLSQMTGSQMSFFNVEESVISKIREMRMDNRLFFCDQLMMVS